MTQEEKSLLEENEETVQILLKLLKEVQDAYQLGLLTCPLNERELLLFRAKIEGISEYLGIVKTRLTRQGKSKKSRVLP